MTVHRSDSMTAGWMRSIGYALARRVARSPAQTLLDRYPLQSIKRTVFAPRVAHVLQTLDALEAAGVSAWLAGGWGIDALIGRTTRSHDDIDIVLDSFADPIPAALLALASLGIRHVNDRAVAGPWMPNLIQVTDQRGTVVDLLPMDRTRLPSPTPFTTGILAGRSVPCLSAEVQIAFHRGYRQRRSQRRDVLRLIAQSGFSMHLDPPPGKLGRWGRRRRHDVLRICQRVRRMPPSRESAIVLLVPAADDLLRAASQVSTKPVPAVPAHITVLYPFVPASRLTADLERNVAMIAAVFPSFSFRLTHIASFPNVVYAAPEPAEPFVDLTKIFAAYWPEHPPYGGVHDEVVPHLSLLEGPSTLTLPEAINRRLPLDATAAELALLVASDDGTWQTVRRFPLGRQEPEHPGGGRSSTFEDAPM